MLQHLWSRSLGHAVRGLSFAREGELLFARDESQVLTLLNSRGEVQAGARIANVSAAAISDDGSTLVAAGSAGQVWWLAPDLTTRRERSIGAPALAVVTDPFGQYLAVSDRNGGLHLLDRNGRTLGQFSTPRPVHHLAFVPMQPHLAAAADLGWAGLLDLTSGNWLWTDRPVSNIGSLAVAGSGDPVLLACFSIGLRRYNSGGHRASTNLPKPCGLIALSFDGKKGVAAGAGHEVYVVNENGELMRTLELDHTPMSLAFSATGDRMYCGFANGAVAAYDV